MRILVFICFAFLLPVIIGCQSQRATTSTQGIQRDGLSFETAIVAKSIPDEYKWIQANYPGSKVVSQALTNQNEKPFDILTVKLADGSEKKFYFDISKFFGKF
jgi:hypothetical protein